MFAENIRDGIAKRLGNSREVIRDHLAEMAVLPNPPNADLKKGFTVAQVAIISDAHTTHDKAYATGAEIRARHNATLPNISSFGIKIAATEAESL